MKNNDLSTKSDNKIYILIFLSFFYFHYLIIHMPRIMEIKTNLTSPQILYTRKTKRFLNKRKRLPEK